MTADDVAKALDEFVGLVDNRLPERFYGGEGHWRLTGTALVARIAGIVGSIRALVHTGRQADTMTLLRSLYEHVLLFCWIAIDPEERVYRWRDHAVIYRKKLHNDAVDFGLELMNEDQLAEAKTLEELPGLQTRADEVDAFWSQRIRGFRPQASAGASKQLLTFRGLYTGVYRPASRFVHAQIETVTDCIDFGAYPRKPAVVHLESEMDLTQSALAVPISAMALLVCNYRFGWPDDELVRTINDSLLENP